MTSRHLYTNLRSSALVVRTGLHDEKGDPDHLIRMLSKFQQKLSAFYSFQDHEKEMFDRLKRNMIVAHTVAPMHDYEDIKFNGIRMILDHTEQYLSVVDKKTKPSDIIDFFEVVKVFDVWFSFIDKHKNLTTTDASVYPQESFEYYSGVYKSFNPIALKTILGPQYYCVMKPGLRLPLSMMERGIIYVASRNLKQKLKSLSLSRKTIASAVAEVLPNMKAMDVAKLMRLMDAPLLRVPYAFMRGLASKGKFVKVKNVRPEVRSDFKITIENSEVKLIRNPARESQKVKLRLLSYKSSIEFRKKILLYVHGGAFVGPKATSLENFYIKEFATNLKGLSILSMDHPPGPEDPFPVALQQILDSYLWFTSGSEDVVDKIGFHPEEIVLAGDSSGASLISSLIVVLNEIRNMGTSVNPKMPKSMVLLFPKTTLQFDIFPSLMTCVFDQVITMQLLMGACIAYIPMEKRNEEDGSWQYIQNNLSVPADFLTRPEYRVIKSPILSPVRYDKLHQLSHVSLNIMAMGNDPLLDESIEIANMWKGKVRMHVVDGATHGAYVFNYVSRPGSRCIPITTDLIRCAFHDGDKGILHTMT